jgi:hypothetical protein
VYETLASGAGDWIGSAERSTESTDRLPEYRISNELPETNVGRVVVVQFTEDEKTCVDARRDPSKE